MSLERVVTAGIRLSTQSLQDHQMSMMELRRLVETAGGVVIKEFSQARLHPEPATYYGRGKIEEISAVLKGLQVKTVVFDHDLTAGQQKNVEKILKAKVVDRTRLILDIFAQRARSREGQLQVELAQLTYLVPRLTGSWRGYSQQMGGIGVRGPGERKIEVERRYVRDRIKKLRRQIEDIRDHRERAREGRSIVPLPQIALVGYTNAGKSTFLNALVGERVVYADDKLFATLDPTTRRVKLPDGRHVLFSDTVGFIQNLPEGLIQAFQATLEEVSHATIIVHVVDSADPYREKQILSVRSILSELNKDNVPVVVVYNKIDSVDELETEILRQREGIVLSAQTGSGVQEFLSEIENILDRGLVEKTIEVPNTHRYLISSLYRVAHVLDEKNLPSGGRYRVRIDASNLKKILHAIDQKKTN